MSSGNAVAEPRAAAKSGPAALPAKGEPAAQPTSAFAVAESIKAAWLAELQRRAAAFTNPGSPLSAMHLAAEMDAQRKVIDVLASLATIVKG